MRIKEEECLSSRRVGQQSGKGGGGGGAGEGRHQIHLHTTANMISFLEENKHMATYIYRGLASLE